jgi:hypothetical protein
MVAYMHPSTAQALLDQSRRRTEALRNRRTVVAKLRSLGWDEAAARELADIDARMKESKQ